MSFYRYSFAAPALLLLFAISAIGVPIDTSFTYQGKLADGTEPVDGVTCDFEFALWDAESGGNLVGPPPISRSASIVNGLFAVGLDFGSVFDSGQKRWLDIAVQCPGDASFTTLSPRTEVTPTPQAQFATTAGNLADGETDPVFQASSAADITGSDKANWDTAFSWGDHSAEGYLTVEADGDPTNELQDLSLSGNTLILSDDASTVDLSGALGQIVGGGSAFNSGGDSDNYLPMSASGRTADYDGVKTRIPIAGTISDLAGMLSADTATGSYAFTVMKNGADTSITCSVSGVSTFSCTDLINCAVFSMGDTIAVRATGSGAENRILRWNGIFTPGGSCP